MANHFVLKSVKLYGIWGKRGILQKIVSIFFGQNAYIVCYFHVLSLLNVAIMLPFSNRVQKIVNIQ